MQRYILSDEEEHKQLIDLIEDMLEYEPERRYFTNITIILSSKKKKSFQFLITKRITLEKALGHPFFDKLPHHLRHHDDPRLGNLIK